MALQKCTLTIDNRQRELQPHGSIEFSCAAFASTHTDRTDDEIPWHWHEDIEIIYIVEGCMTVQVPGKDFDVQNGQCVFINSGILHRAYTNSYGLLQSLVFSPTLLTGNAHSIFAQKYLDPLLHCTSLEGILFKTDTSWQQEAVKSFLIAFEAIHTEINGYEFVVREQLSRICFLLYTQYYSEFKHTHTEINPDKKRMCRMLDYIHEHYEEDISLAHIAQSANIGERECLRCFKRIIQISPMQYVLKHRIMKGSTMLTAHPERSIADISSRCGFDSPSNFSKMFKNFFACTPTEYRNSLVPS